LIVGRHPQPQLLLADGRGAWLFLVTRLPITLTSFWSGFSPQGPLDQGGPVENRSLLGWPVETRAGRTASGWCLRLAQGSIVSLEFPLHGQEILDPALYFCELRGDHLLEPGP
jgi:hypothetical protein